MRNAIRNGTVVQNKTLRITFLILGFICLGLGVAGIILPLMPGTLFIILSAYFFTRSSSKFYNWLRSNPLFGKYVRFYLLGGKMPLYAKIVTFGIIIVSLIIGVVII